MEVSRVLYQNLDMVKWIVLIQRPSPPQIRRDDSVKEKEREDGQSNATSSKRALKARGRLGK